MYSIAVWYDYGKRGLEKSKSDAFKWYMKASIAGNAKGMAMAGWYMVWKHENVANDLPEGLHLLHLAAEKGSNVACFHLGEIYYKGYIFSRPGVGIEKNYEGKEMARKDG